MRQLSVTDTSMLAYESPRTPNHVTTIGIYDPSTSPTGAPSYEQIADKLVACLASAPALREKLAFLPLGLDRPYWIDDPEFDIEFHLRHLALPRPGNKRQFRAQIGRLHARPLDLTRPPWEMTIIDGVDAVDGMPTGCFATVLKMHHAAVDGQSGVQLLQLMHDLSPDAGESADEQPP